METLRGKFLEWENAKPEIIMSDCAQAYNWDFKKLMPEARHIHCIWYVYMA